MKKMLVPTLILALLVTILMSAGPVHAQSENACWGQATKVFARMGAMGEHSSSFETPRLGLGNLARELYSAGVIEADTMQALGQFVASELGLEISSCR